MPSQPIGVESGGTLGSNQRRCLTLLPSGSSCCPGDFRPLLRGKLSSPPLASLSTTLSAVRGFPVVLPLFAGSYLDDLDSIADHVGGALLAFGASRHYCPSLLQCGQSNDIINAKPFPVLIADFDMQEILLIKFVEFRQNFGGGVQQEAAKDLRPCLSSWGSMHDPRPSAAALGVNPSLIWMTEFRGRLNSAGASCVWTTFVILTI